jgi:hypothetical protein
MAYQINKTDGTLVATVADSQIDVLSTDLTLIGKNYSGFGEELNENFVKLLENFSGSTIPSHPIRGQLWFDTSENKIKVYTGAEFVPVSSATIATTRPSSLGIGDLWFDDTNKQLYFFDGTNTILLAPTFSQSQGLSGLKVESILDTLNQTRVVTYLFNNGILLGIFAKDFFTPKNAIPGYTGDITPGFNAGDLENIKFDVTCTNSDRLGGADAITYVRKDTSSAIDGQIRITSDLGLIIGSAGQGNFTVNNSNLNIQNTAADKNINFQVRRGLAVEDAVVINAVERSVNIYQGINTSQVNIGGNLLIEGNLTVQGSTTVINTAEVTVEDKNIVLARQVGVTPTDGNASGGGIILQGANSHIFLWSELGDAAQPATSSALIAGYSDALPELASQAWTSSEHINLASGKEFKINGVTVLSGNSLGLGITSIPGVTSFGKQTVINIGPGIISDPAFLRLEDNRISTLQTNQNLELAPNGTGNIVLIGNPKITGLLDPTGPQDAATKEYVDFTVETRNIVLSIDLSDGKPNNYIVTNILNNIAPPAEYRNGTLARILCNIITNSTVSLNINPLISQSTATFTTPTGTAPAVTNVAISSATVPAQPIQTTRIVKIFQVILGAWNHVSDTVLPP